MAPRSGTVRMDSWSAMARGALPVSFTCSHVRVAGGWRWCLGHRPLEGFMLRLFADYMPLFEEMCRLPAVMKRW